MGGIPNPACKACSLGISQAGKGGSAVSQSETVEIQDFGLWDKMKGERALMSFDLELTARCNNNCRHCYINLPVNDAEARAKELTLAEINHIADQAVELGAVWCLLTGGEPLLREDFAEIYLALKRKGLLLAVFTNATAIRAEHIELFKKYPPRDIEVTVYGSRQETYERVARKAGSFVAFQAGLDALIEAGIKVRLKAMALRSNLEDMEQIASFSKERTKDYYRFDPQLHLRYDHDLRRNAEIEAERLTSEEYVALERADEERFGALQKNCSVLIDDAFLKSDGGYLFRCGAGMSSFTVGYDGAFRLCSVLNAPGTTVNLREVSLREAWEGWVPQVRGLRSDRSTYLETCQRCPILNLCMHCPAHAHLESGAMDGETPYFCSLAHARARAIQGQD